jgi:methylated-DNA-[protein]-cysteine S-methyltransferase
LIPIETPIGCFQAEFSGRGLVRLEFPGDFPSPSAGEGQGEGALLLERELNDYLEGRLRRFTVPLDLRGTAFQREVWGRVLEIPYGRTRSYGEVAAALGRRAAARAVGAANGANPVPILVPCHRLIGASGSLTGYGGGIALKRWLLALESGAR